MIQRPKGWLYLDNNVLSKAAEDNNTATFERFTEKGVPPAYSAVTVSDMFGSERIDERIEFLDRIGAWRVELDSENDVGARCVDERASIFYERYVSGVDITSFQDSFYPLVRFTHTGNFGDPYQHPLNGFLRSMTDFLTDLSDDVPHEFDHVFELVRDALVTEAEKHQPITETPAETEMREEMKNYAAGLQPPDVIAKIERRFPGSFPTDPSFQPGERNHNIIFQTAFMLSAIGYGTDKRIKNRDDTKALKGAKSTWHDAQHITHAFFAGVLVCKDEGMRKITEAIAEHMQIDFPILSYVSGPE